MISGDKCRKIAKYLPIDHCNEGCGYVSPPEGIEFRGIPYQWQSDNSLPYIDHVRISDKFIVASVNALDVSEIIFEEDPK